jgi:putative transferase (TIGR04331 family)
MSALKLSDPKYNIKANQKGTILWVTASWPIQMFRLDHVTTGIYGDKNFIKQKRFLKRLNSKVFENLIMRLYNFEYGWKEEDRLADLVDRTPKFYRGGNSLLTQIKESRLCIHDYFGTTWLETLSMNFPTVIFWEPAQIHFRKSAIPYMDDLRAVNILHDTPESAAKLVNEICEDPIFWWMEPERQRVRKNFCYQFARKSTNGLKEWKKELLNMVNGFNLGKNNSNEI